MTVDANDGRPELVLSSQPTDEELKHAFEEGLRHSFHRHSICIYVEIWLDKEKRDRSKVARLPLSGVLMEIDAQWLVVTAGHCIHNVQKLLDKGYELKRSYFIDSAE